MQDVNPIARNLEAVRRKIAAAAQQAGRAPDSVTLIAVSKNHPRTVVQDAVAAGVQYFGENRVQEAAQKFPLAGARLRVIGPLQSNKVREAIRIADAIDTLDRPKLLLAMEREAQAAGRLPELLVQVNIGDERQKSGIAVTEAAGFIRTAQTCFGPALRGLMCIPPSGCDPLPYFLRLAALADTYGLAVRSMGMSGDFEAAIAAGATHVRIGRAIFGARG